MKSKKISKAARKEALTGLLYISPWLIGLFGLTLFPILVSLGLSFVKWDVISPPKWTGLGNFKELFTDPLFYKSLSVTLYYSALSVPLSLIAGLALSLLLNLKLAGIGFFRTLFYLPSVISGVAVAILWLWIFNADSGLLNFALSLLGIQGPTWLLDPRWIVPCFVIMSLWGVGGSAIIFLGGLQNIPEQLYEAAKIDGAGKWVSFWRITLPLLTPTLFFLLLMGIIGSFQVFTPAYIIGGGGTGGGGGMGGAEHAGLFYMLYLYSKAFNGGQGGFSQMGYAAAMAWIGGIVVFILTVILNSSQKKWVYYSSDIGGGKD